MPRIVSKRLAHTIQRLTVTAAYGDTAYYYAPPDPNTPLDEYGQPTEDVTPIKIACSFSDAIGKNRSLEQWTTDVDISDIELEIRFGAADIVPHKGGKFLLTGKFDETSFPDILFEIIGIRNRGQMGYLCALKRTSI